MPGSANRGVVVSNGEKASHQLFGAPSRILCCEELHKESLMCPCEASYGQHFGCSVCKSSGGDSLPSSVQSGSGSVGVGTQSGFLSQCRTSIRPSEYRGGLAVSALPRLQQLEVMSRGISRSDADPRTLCQGSFRGPTECTAASVFQLEAGPHGARLGCASTGLVEREELCFSSLLLDNAISSEVESIRGRVGVSVPRVAHTGVVPQLAGSVCVSSSPSTHEPESLVRSSRADTSPDCEPDSLPRSMACIKQSLQAEGICADASGLILGAWRPGTNAVYNSAWKKWHSWCLARESDSFRPALADITSFLSDCFNEGLEYRTLNTYRSALSGVLPPMDGFPVGQHPLVVRLLKGVQNLRPALPRYQHSWNVDIVLNYLRTLPGNKELSLKLLTQKLAVLLALTAPKRSSELQLLDLRFMRILPEGVEFKLPGLTKTSREVTSVFFAKYVDCDDLCVLRCLQCYIGRTSSFRPVLSPDTYSPLLVSYHKPHRPVKSCSISRWIKSVLQSAGIDTSIFKGHSTRSASTSKARSRGVPLEEVVKMADWSGTSTFKRFYYRPTFDQAYAKAVLSLPTE